MEVKRGNDRLVILIPSLQIALKFPRIYLHNAWDNIASCFTDKGHWKYELFKWTTQADGTLKHWLFRGIMANWLEFCYYMSTRYSFIVPTYFSLFGLVNIQQFSEPCSFNSSDFLSQLVDSTDQEICRDPDVNGHHFMKSANFSLQGGKWRAIDYGAIDAQATLTKYGKKIQDNFDPNYNWEKRKQELEIEEQNQTAR
jgi:hypothetical protein